MFKWIPSARIICIASRNFSVASVLRYEKRPRVLPVCHQVIGDHNSQYFTSYPYKTKEEMEVRELLEQSRPYLLGHRYRRPNLSPKKFRRIKKKMTAEGHIFPDTPMRDRMLDQIPMVK